METKIHLLIWVLLVFQRDLTQGGESISASTESKVAPECPVEISPQRAVVRYGDPVTAKCTTTQTARGIGWEATVGATGMKTDVQSVTWNVSSLTDWTAEPKCYGNFLTEPKQCGKNLIIILYKYPDSVSLSSDSPVDQMVEGIQYQLQCEIKNIAPIQNLTVNWYRGQTLIHNQTFSHNTTRTPGNVSATLLFTPDRADNGQQLTCEAELNLGPEGPQPPPTNQSDPLSITMLYEPEITGCPLSVDVKEHHSLESSVTCTAEGSPPPKTRWVKDGQQIDPSVKLNRTDGGEFTYEATNTQGSVNHTVTVEVRYGPEITGCPLSVDVEEHHSLESSVTCTAEGSPPPETRWVKDGQQIDPSVKLTRTHEGQFTYEATNTQGAVNHTVNISVIYAPEITGCPLSVDVEEHHSLQSSVNCTTEGSPPPETRWVKDGKQIDPSVKLTRTDGGQFTYEATNTQGTVNHTVTVKVRYGPEISWCPLCVAVEEHRSLQSSVNCTAEGSPLPQTRWVKDGQQIDPSVKLTRTDGGEFTYEATNTQGTVNHTVNISVQYGPEITGCPLSVDVEEHHSLQSSVNCTAEGSPPPETRWVKDGQQIDPSVKLTRTDEGQFTYEATNTQGTMSKNISITVVYGPEITGCPLSVDVEEHHSLQSSVTCTAEGSPPPETRWVKDGQQIDPSVKLTRTHGGQFTYEATNTQGTVRHTVNVTVQYKPTFVSLNKTHLFASGETVILTCRAEGSPSPQYHWNYSRGPDIKTMTTDSKSEITIAAASVGDGGQYKCIATNSLGQAVKIFTVIVEEQDHTLLLKTIDFVRQIIFSTNEDKKTADITTEMRGHACWIWGIVMLSLSGCGAVPECPLEISPQRAVVRYGDPVTVNCTATQTPRGMGWEAPVGSTGMRKDVQSVIWNVSSLTHWTAEPKCFGNFNTEPRQCRKNLNIRLYKYPDSVSINSGSPVVQMVEGRQYQLQCEVQNIVPVQYLTVNWYRGQTLIHSQTFSHNTTRTPVNVSAALLFTPDRADNGQQLTCEAELNLGPEGPQPPPAKQSDPLLITLKALRSIGLYGPVITCPPSATVKEGQSLESSVPCTAVGNPPPDTQWLIEGQELEPDEPLSRRDTGLFTFEAENRYGKVTQDVDVTVIYGAEITGCPLSVDVEEHHNLQSSVTCTAEGSPPPETRWVKDEQQIDPSVKLTRTDGGQFTYEATNTQGTASHTVTVEIRYKPQFVQSTESLSLAAGGSVVLNCSAEGSPLPQYHWRYLEAPNVQDSSTGGWSVVNITAATPENSGQYTCTARNYLGDTTRTFTLTVREDEEGAVPDCPLEISPQRVVVRYGDPVTANCTTTQTARGIGWEATVGSTGMKADVQSVTWNVSSLTDWTAEPKCDKKFRFHLITAMDKLSKYCFEYCFERIYQGYKDTYVHTHILIDSKPKWLTGCLKCKTMVLTVLESGLSLNHLMKCRIYIIYLFRILIFLFQELLSCTIYFKSKFRLQSTDGPVITCPPSATVKEGQSLESSVPCTAVGNPPPDTQWLIDAQKTVPDWPLSRRDTGLFTFQAENRYGRVKRNVNITVIYKPQFVQSNESLSLVAGGSVVLNCSAEGSPLPQYHWRYPKAPNVQDSSTGGWSVVNITAATPENSGQYTCTARNHLGDTARTFTLTVEQKSRASEDCPIQIRPSRLVVRYGDPVRAECTATQPLRGMGWEATAGPTGMQIVSQVVTWNVSSLTDWTSEPKCFGNFYQTPKQCEKKLTIVLYKLPDSVSLNQTVQMVEGRQYQLQCEVQNIAPVQYLTVNWYRGKTLIHSRTFSHNTTRTPVNVSATLLFTPDRADNGQQLTCEAELNLGPEGPQPPPANQSDPLRIAVLYKPVFTSTGPTAVQVPPGTRIFLNSSADGNPPPTFEWKYSSASRVQVTTNRDTSVAAVTVNSEADAGAYTCIAANTEGRASQTFTIVLSNRFRYCRGDCGSAYTPPGRRLDGLILCVEEEIVSRLVKHP
nr:PREDICTED: intercellular adhesion molecule 5 [Lepisosteus oculatus]